MDSETVETLQDLLKHARAGEVIGFALPVGAPVVAPYGSGALTFAADSGAAGKYTVAASSGGVTRLSSVLTVTTGVNAAANFTFP